MLRSLLCLLAILCLSTFAGAWWDPGHMTVAQIAYGRLTPEARAQADALIAAPITPGDERSNTFVTAACWADDHKRSLNTGNWHYINVPFSLDGTELTTVTAKIAGYSFDVVRAIRLSTAMLQSTTATLEQKAPYLRYLIHCVGDIHQPMHSTTAVWADSPGGDAGGNGFTLAGDPRNLHALWDSGAGWAAGEIFRPLDTTGEAILKGLAKDAEASLPYAAGPAGIVDPMEWANESAILAREKAYAGLTRGGAPSPEYLAEAQAIAKQRVALAGYRLADLLNTILTEVPAAAH